MKKIAAFGAGLAAWESAVHLSLLAAQSEPTLFGIRLTRRINAFQSIVPALFSVTLLRYAFGARHHSSFA